jgi:hypothetical protein
MKGEMREVERGDGVARLDMVAVTCGELLTRLNR